MSDNPRLMPPSDGKFGPHANPGEGLASPISLGGPTDSAIEEAIGKARKHANENSHEAAQAWALIALAEATYKHM